MAFRFTSNHVHTISTMKHFSIHREPTIMIGNN
eukprot:UN04136